MAGEAVVEGVGLVKVFRGGGLFGSRLVRAVDGVDIVVRSGEGVGVVGESGSGKSTLGRLLLLLLKPDRGRVLFHGRDITGLAGGELRRLRRWMQLVPQDPYASFNPLRPVGEQVAEPLVVHGVVSTLGEARKRILEAMERVGLVPAEELYRRLPGQLSGGQLQRLAILRALLLEPDFIVADEPTSSLDVSVRAGVLEMLEEYKRGGGALLFISHDLGAARLVSDRVAVMYLGKIVEEAPTERLLSRPLHPYTAALLTAVPSIYGKRVSVRVRLKGDIPDPSRPPTGCRLHPRCPFAGEECRAREPALQEVEEGHRVACHRPLTGG